MSVSICLQKDYRSGRFPLMCCRNSRISIFEDEYSDSSSRKLHRRQSCDIIKYYAACSRRRLVSSRNIFRATRYGGGEQETR
jgi:hypothetical protein